MKNKKHLGQHWLKNRSILDQIAGLAASNAQALTCLEIGPGLGTLTSSLFKFFPSIWAIEFDTNLANNLPKSFPGKNLIVKNQDFLQFDLNQLTSPYVAVGNIPYYITSPIIQKLLNSANPPTRIVLLIQKEVAVRAAALDGRESLLSLTIKNLADLELGPLVLRDQFTPPPKVDSQVIILRPHPPLVSEQALKLASLGFSSPRKKVIANLPGDREQLRQDFLSLGLDPDFRPANLSLLDWQSLAEIKHKR